MIRIKCPKCDALLNADDSRAGTTARCPRCGQTLQVPGGKEGIVPDRPTAGATAAKPSARPAGDPRKKPRREDNEEIETEFEIVEEEAPRTRGQQRPRDAADEDDRPRRAPVRPREEEDEDEAPERRPRKKKKRRYEPGRNTLLTLVAIDAGASLLLGILVLAGAPLGFALLGPPLTPLHYIGIIFLNTWVLGLVVLGRGLVGAGLGYFEYIGQDLARVIHAGLLLSWAALAGLGCIIWIVNMIRFGGRVSFSAQEVLFLILAIFWQAGHCILGFQFLRHPDVQRYIATKA